MIFVNNAGLLHFSAAGDKIVKDIRPGVPFEPTYIYRLLTLSKSSLSEKVRFCFVIISTLATS